VLPSQHSSTMRSGRHARMFRSERAKGVGSQQKEVIYEQLRKRSALYHR
jgi:hypothetical protein